VSDRYRSTARMVPTLRVPIRNLPTRQERFQQGLSELSAADEVHQKVEGVVCVVQHGHHGVSEVVYRLISIAERRSSAVGVVDDESIDG